MPSKETLSGERLILIHGSIEDHGNDAINVSVHRETCRGEPKFPSHRGADRTHIELLPFDC